LFVFLAQNSSKFRAAAVPGITSAQGLQRTSDGVLILICCRFIVHDLSSVCCKTLVAPCEPHDYKNRPVQFPAWMLYKATKPGFWFF